MAISISGLNERRGRTSERKGNASKVKTAKLDNVVIIKGHNYGFKKTKIKLIEN